MFAFKRKLPTKITEENEGIEEESTWAIKKK